MAVSKTELLRMLAEAAALEEKAIPIYGAHLETAVFWSGLDKWRQEQLRIYLRILSKESAHHLRVLSAMKKAITEDARDVF